MNINKKYIIIFGTLVLLLVIILGGITYYKEKGTQTSGANQSFLAFSQSYPDSLNKFYDFLDLSHNALSSNMEELKNKKIKEVACEIVKILPEYINLYTSSDKPYLPLFYSLSNVLSFKSNSYVGISVDLKDVIREYDSSFLEREKLYFCSISEPSWLDVFYLQIEPKFNLIFDEGDVSCGEIKADEISFMSFSGFIPQAEFLNIKQYLVEEQTVSEVINKQSFHEIKEILKDYPVIWQMEKPITI
jgi:uncharacterized pyridoxamine 5'-phosphate oxidase family protein